ncbi:MAG: hypothetical protein M0P13_01300 [Fibrobacteraceae bacterium]|nr:hypothetical protein [Fibrobacteraceae bacterium]
MYISRNMCDGKKIEKRLSSVIFENLKELLKAKNAAHESMFKFHWKKMWPFSLIWPQVDYLRIIRFMGEVKTQSLDQKTFIHNHLGQALPDEKTFLDTVIPYLDALAVSCDKLAEVARFKQDLLEKVKDRSVFKFKKILDEYKEAQDSLVRAGAFVQVSWTELYAQSAKQEPSKNSAAKRST